MKWIRLCLLLLGCLVARLGSAEVVCADSDEWQQVTLDENQLLIALLRVNGTPLSAGFDVFQHQDQYLVPMQSLEDLLELGWNIDQTSQTIDSGSDSQSLFCEFAITLRDRVEPQGLFWGQDDFDLYVDIRFIPLILGGSAIFAYDLQQLQILTEVAIPGLLRQNAIDIPSFIAEQVVQPDLVVVDQYWLATSPQLNYRLTGNYLSEQDELRTNASVNTFFDIAHHSAELRFNRSSSGTKQFLRLSKNLSSGSVEDDDNIIRYEVGDLQLQSDELVLRAKQAAGLSIFNFNPNTSRNFSNITITETVLPGWRAQLFRNGQFIQELFSDDTNQVVFENVDTFYGNNLFEIKLYGPEGQQEIRTQRVNVGNEQLSAGRINYQFNLSDARIRTIDDDLSPSEYDQTFSGLMSFGLTDRTTIEASAYSLRGDGKRQDYISSAFYHNFSNMALKTQIVKDTDQGAAIFAGVNANFDRRLRLNLSTRYFDDFSSDAYTQEQDVKSESRLRLNGSANIGSGLAWNANILHRTFNERENNSIVTLGLNNNLLGGTFSTSLSYNPTSSDQRLLHRLYWSKNIAGWQLSNSLEWLPDNDQKVQNYYTTIRWPQKYATFNQSRIDYRGNQDDKLSVSHRFNWRRDEFNLQFGTTLDSGGHWRVNFGISGDIEYNPFSESLDFYRPRGGSVANIHALAYLDNNRNNVFDDADEALPDVVIEGRQNWRNKSTNQQGLVQLATTSRRQPVTISEASLPDPFMRPSSQLALVETHKGGLNRIALPVVTFSDVEGAVYWVKGQSSRGTGGIPLSFINEQQDVVATVRTEADGYFYVSNLAPGQYNLEVDPEYLKSNQLIIANKPSAITAPALGDAIRINDLLLVDQSDAQLVTLKSVPTSSPVNAKFYAQLGAFKKPSSIIEVLKHLPTDRYDLRIYRHHESALSHVVLGGYETHAEASNAIELINQDASFTDAFVTNTARYVQAGWQLEYELKSVSEHIEASHADVQNQSKDVYFCMLASYRSLTSIDATKLNDIFNIKVARRYVKGVRYYSLFVGPVRSPSICRQQSVPQSLSKSAPFAILQSTMANQLLSSDPKN